MLTLLGVVAVAMARLRNLFAVAMLFGIFSLLSAALFVALDAVDVAFTEAAVGAGISTILMLATLSLTSAQQRKAPRLRLGPFLAVILTGALLVDATLDLPLFGAADAPVHRHVAPRYIDESPREVGLPNMVTSVLASYRGYDTLGEVTVIFTAGVGVLCLIGGSGGRRTSGRVRGDG